MDFVKARAQMVDLQLAKRGIDDPRVLDAFRIVPREQFLPDNLVEFAYEDNPLPIGKDQTISQPYIVALTTASLRLQGHERVLEVGTGSGYAAAILSQLAREVFTIERIESLANQARIRIADLGYDNVKVLAGDGTLGWRTHAPYDGIAVAAGAPEVPHALLDQLVIGGCLVMPLGPSDSQVLVRITREGDTEFSQEDLCSVRFVPLIGDQETAERKGREALRRPSHPNRDPVVAKLVRELAEPISDIASAPVDALLDRIGDARVVLLGESTHGTSEFYRMRARITHELITRGGFDFVAVEADWPDAASMNALISGTPVPTPVEFTPFSRFPTWMWRNKETADFTHWLQGHNQGQHGARRPVGFHGLDLYSMFTSMAVVLAYLDDIAPQAAQVARHRYSALTPWQKDPAEYGRAVLTGRYSSSESAVIAALGDMLAKRLEYAKQDGERFFDAAQNARVVANSEHYYRAMYYGSSASWNLRDEHMFETLQSLLSFYGPNSRGVVWEHNSHVGNANATEMSTRGQLNIGQLCREEFGDKAYLVGFSTDHGTVAAASNWDAPMQQMRIRQAHPDSYEHLFHESGVEAFMLHLRAPRRADLRNELVAPRLERAIGVVYRPETELASHYFQASLPHQFDEIIWFDETRAITPLDRGVRIEAPHARG